MLTRIAILWVLFALVAGFALGGSFVSAFLIPQAQQQGNANTEKPNTNRQSPEERRETTEEAIAYYNKWLMFFTAILAVATVGLGLATVGLYLTGEKQIAVAKESADAAKLNAEALIDAERAHLYPVIKSTNLHEALRAAIWYDNSPSMDDSFISNRPAVDFVLKNLGRTPAILKEVSYRVIQGTAGQRQFDYTVGSIGNPVIDGGAETTPPVPCGLETTFTVGQSRQALHGSHPLMFYGYVIYETSFEREYEYRWRYENSGIYWNLAHYDEYQRRSQRPRVTVRYL